MTVKKNLPLRMYLTKKTDRVNEERENTKDRQKERRENIRREKRQKRDEPNASRIDRKISKSRVLHSDYRERFVSETIPHKRRRDRVKEERENIRARMKETRENIRTEKKEKRDQANGSRHNGNCSTETKRSSESVSPNVCGKAKNKCNELHCIHKDIVRFKQKAKMCKKKSRHLGNHKEGTNCKSHGVKYKQNAKNCNCKVSITN